MRLPWLFVELYHIAFRFTGRFIYPEIIFLLINKMCYYFAINQPSLQGEDS